MRSLFLFAIGLLAVMPLAGCNRLQYSGTISVERLKYEAREFELPLVNKATVTVKSSAPIDVYIGLQSKMKETKEALDSERTPKDVLAKETKTTEKTFEITPEKQPFVLYLIARNEKADVTVTAVGR